MAASEDRYSKIVSVLKILLPLAALGILSTLFLVSQRGSPTTPIRYGDVENIARESRVGAPTYSGVTETGVAVTVRAREAWLGSSASDPIMVEAPEARIESDASAAEVSADVGILDRGSDVLKLSGAVRLETSGGYVVTSDDVELGLGAAGVTSTGPIEAEGPPGRISAESMRFTGGTDGGDELVFKGNVRLLYQPPTD